MFANDDFNDLSMEDADYFEYLSSLFKNNDPAETFPGIDLSQMNNDNLAMDDIGSQWPSNKEQGDVQAPIRVADNQPSTLYALNAGPDFMAPPETAPDDEFTILGEFLEIAQFLEMSSLSEDLLTTGESEIVPPSNSVFDEVMGVMKVNVQPLPDLRGRYASDGPRFLPRRKTNPVSIGLPNLSSINLTKDQAIGIIVTMVTSMDNPKGQTFVHVNDIVYRTDDAIVLGNGSFFLPLTKLDIAQCEKKFPRLSIICKKFDAYNFDLISFSTITPERLMEKYTVPDESTIGKVAKGKRFAQEYNLFSYKLVFQLAMKDDDAYFVSNIKCETNLINEKKAADAKPKNADSCKTTSTTASRKRSSNDASARPSKRSKRSTRDSQ